MEEKINLIARLLLINRKAENLKDRFDRYYSNQYIQQVKGLEYDDIYTGLQREWMEMVIERTDIEEKLAELIKEF